MPHRSRSLRCTAHSVPDKHCPHSRPVVCADIVCAVGVVMAVLFVSEHCRCCGCAVHVAVDNVIVLFHVAIIVLSKG